MGSHLWRVGLSLGLLALMQGGAAQNTAALGRETAQGRQVCSGCVVSTQWTFQGFAIKNNNTLNMGSYEIFGGFDQNAIKAAIEDRYNIKMEKLVWEASFFGEYVFAKNGNRPLKLTTRSGENDSATSSSVFEPKPHLKSVTVSGLTGYGGFGTQYMYPKEFASCAAAGAQCQKSNFGIFMPQGLKIELGEELGEPEQP